MAQQVRAVQPNEHSKEVPHLEGQQEALTQLLEVGKFCHCCVQGKVSAGRRPVDR